MWLSDFFLLEFPEFDHIMAYITMLFFLWLSNVLLEWSHASYVYIRL